MSSRVAEVSVDQGATIYAAKPWRPDSKRDGDAADAPPPLADE